MNEEVHFFATKGRITRRALFYRFLFMSALLIISNCIYFCVALPKYEHYTSISGGIELDNSFFRSYNYFKNFNLFALPIFSFIFISIQSVKRIHDTNNSGWNFLFPVYNLILLFQKGSQGQNDFGIDPRPLKEYKYFEDIKEP